MRQQQKKIHLGHAKLKLQPGKPGTRVQPGRYSTAGEVLVHIYFVRFADSTQHRWTPRHVIAASLDGR